MRDLLFWQWLWLSSVPEIFDDTVGSAALALTDAASAALVLTDAASAVNVLTDAASAELALLPVNG